VIPTPSPPQKSYDKLIVNMHDSDHGWCDSVVRVKGPWKVLAEEHSEGGANILKYWIGPTKERVGFLSGLGEGP